jgi:hypothetical protein
MSDQHKEEIEHHSPEEIIGILRSITKLSIVDDKLEACFENGCHPESIPSFIPKSFTRKLLELIEEHLRVK